MYESGRICPLHLQEMVYSSIQRPSLPPCQCADVGDVDQSAWDLVMEMKALQLISRGRRKSQPIFFRQPAWCALYSRGDRNQLDLKDLESQPGRQRTKLSCSERKKLPMGTVRNQRLLSFDGVDMDLISRIYAIPF